MKKTVIRLEYSSKEQRNHILETLHRHSIKTISGKRTTIYDGDNINLCIRQNIYSEGVETVSVCSDKYHDLSFPYRIFCLLYGETPVSDVITLTVNGKDVELSQETLDQITKAIN